MSRGDATLEEAKEAWKEKVKKDMTKQEQNTKKKEGKGKGRGRRKRRRSSKNSDVSQNQGQNQNTNKNQGKSNKGQGNWRERNQFYKKQGKNNRNFVKKEQVGITKEQKEKLLKEKYKTVEQIKYTNNYHRDI
mmetsp:Transcript_4844/g.7166  ORF Transcript_4844/g.7166 Transcript_4844/m.7166 type:complete len:133 (+) Transcript_4844:967-1365(+)